MPAYLEKILKKQAAKRQLKGERKDAYVYGTMQKITSWRPGKKKAK